METKYIVILLNSNLSSKNKIFSVLAIIESWIQEKYVILENERVQQYILSEILYIYEKNENSKITTSWLKQRLSYIIRTLTEHSFITLRTTYEYSIEFIDQIRDQSDFQFFPEKTRKLKIQGWQKKTQERFEKYCLLHPQKTQKKKNSKKIVQLFLPFMENEAKKMENFCATI